MDGLRTHAAGEHVIDHLARHGRHREFLAFRRRVEPVVARGVVEHQRALGAGDLDPGRAVVREALREIPAAADHHHHAVVHRHGGEHHVVRAVDRLHVAVGALRIDADRLGRLEQPHHEVEVVRALHHHRRKPHPARDLLAERPRQMPADQHRHHLAERAVDDLLLGVGDLGVEALRIADGEFQVVALGEHDQLVGFPQLERDRLLQHHVLAGAQAVARDRVVVRFRRGRDEHHRDVVVVDDVLVVGVAVAGLYSAFTSARRSGRMSQRCSLSTSAVRASVSARVPPTHPTPMTAASTCFTWCFLTLVLRCGATNHERRRLRKRDGRPCKQIRQEKGRPLRPAFPIVDCERPTTSPPAPAPASTARGGCARRWRRTPRWRSPPPAAAWSPRRRRSAAGRDGRARPRRPAPGSR